MNPNTYKKEFEIRPHEQCKNIFTSLRESISREESNITNHNFPKSEKTLLFLPVDCEKELEEFKKQTYDTNIQFRCQQLYEITKPYKVEYNHDIQRVTVSSDGIGV
jgi:hypothetical protein